MKLHYKLFIPFLPFFQVIVSIQQINDSKTFFTTLNQNNLVLVDFFMPGCTPCARLLNTLEPLSHNSNFADIIFIKVDVTSMPELAKTFHISSVPVLKIFKKGTPVYSHVGFLNSNEIQQALQNSRNR